MKLTNAADKPMNFSATPNVEDALSGWLRTLKVAKITKTIIDFEVSEAREYFDVQAVRQPASTKQLMILPYGQRAWQIDSLHIKASEVEFCLDDQFFIDDKKYRVLQKWEWGDRGYINYLVTEDWGQSFNQAASESISTAETVGGEIGT